MQLYFDRQHHTVSEHERRLTAVLANDDNAPIDVTYEVETASRSARDVRWAVAGPSRLEPGERATVVVTLNLAADDHREPLRVRLAAVSTGAGASRTAETPVTRSPLYQRVSSPLVSVAVLLQRHGAVTYDD